MDGNRNQGGNRRSRGNCDQKIFVEKISFQLNKNAFMISYIAYWKMKEKEINIKNEKCKRLNDTKVKIYIWRRIIYQK